MRNEKPQQADTSRVAPVDWLLLGLLSLIWGSSFILIKKGIIVYSPDEMAVLRICITAASMGVIFFFIRFERVPLRKLPWIGLVGVFGSGLPAFMFAVAETQVPSSVAGILNAMTPIFTWISGLLLFSIGFSRNHILGIVIGLAGAIMIIMFDREFRFSFHPYTLFAILGTVGYGISGNIVKTHLQDIHPITLNSISFFIIGIPVMLYGLTTSIGEKTANDPEAIFSLGAIVILSLLGTVVANIMYFKLIQRTNQVFASTVAYLIPLTALAWGFIDGEPLAWTHVIGMVLILGGIYVVRKA